MVTFRLFHICTSILIIYIYIRWFNNYSKININFTWLDSLLAFEIVSIVYKIVLTFFPIYCFLTNKKKSCVCFYCLVCAFWFFFFHIFESWLCFFLVSLFLKLNDLLVALVGFSVRRFQGSRYTEKSSSQSTFYC